MSFGVLCVCAAVLLLVECSFWSGSLVSLFVWGFLWLGGIFSLFGNAVVWGVAVL